MNTNHKKFKVDFICNQKQLGDILVSLAPYKVSDFNFGLVTDVPYSENSKRASGITAHVKSMLEANQSITREKFVTTLMAMGFTRAQISATITRLKTAKVLKVKGDDIVAFK